MIEFRKILCPVEFESNSVAALDLAKSVALKYQAKLYLLNVARIPAADMDAPVAISPHPHWERVAYDRLKEIARENLGDDVSYELVVKDGIPESAILEAVTDLGIDLVVMASHGRTGIAHLVMGSVAEEMMRTLPCPVMVVKPHK